MSEDSKISKFDDATKRQESYAKQLEDALNTQLEEMKEIGPFSPYSGLCWSEASALEYAASYNLAGLVAYLNDVLRLKPKKVYKQ
jgi:hypothetical protein